MTTRKTLKQTHEARQEQRAKEQADRMLTLRKLVDAGVGEELLLDSLMRIADSLELLSLVVGVLGERELEESA